MDGGWTPWLALVALLAAGWLGYQWRAGQARQAQAERDRRTAEQAAQAAEQTARQQAARLAALLTAEADAVLLVDAAGVVQELNAAAASLFGPRAAAGQTLIAATRSVELDELAAHVLGGGDDDDRQALVNGLPFRVRAARAGDHGLALVLKDLSELQRLGRARRDFIANISHELRTPLTSIRLLTESNLAGPARAPEPWAGLLAKIHTEVRALEQMAQELLDLARIESGQAIARLVPTPVDEVVRAAAERLRPQAEHRGLRLEVDAPAGLLALVDADQVSRVLGNLIHNALKFTAAPGAIGVRVQPAGDEILVQVADTGAGVPPADRTRVFERFYRGDRSRAGGGTGLGLAIAKHVVEAHGGRIWVDNQALPGYPGATFSFTLLAAGRPEAP